MTEPRYTYLHVDCSAEEVDMLSATLWGLGAEGVEERDGKTMSPAAVSSTADQSKGGVMLVAYFSSEEVAAAAIEVLPKKGRPRIEHVVGDAWRDGWREFFKPARFGRRLVLRPSWEEVRTFDDDVVLTIDPEHAFGSGTHETTRLVLRELSRTVLGGERVLDVGCGSGILAVAALLLGAERAVGVDIEADAVIVSEANAIRNGVGDRLSVSTDDVRRVEGTYEIICANIRTEALCSMVDVLEARLAPGGRLYLSGILAVEEAEIRAAFAPMRALRCTGEGEWIAFAYAKRS